jgi:hypothetical protein
MVTTLRIRRPFVIKFNGTCNVFLSALRRTRKVVNYIVKPRPVRVLFCAANLAADEYSSLSSFLVLIQARDFPVRT